LRGREGKERKGKGEVERRKRKGEKG